MEATEVLTAAPAPAAAPRQRGAWNVSWLSPLACRAIFVALLAFGFFSHLRYLTHDCPIDLSPDEAHYWDWSRRLDWSYYSKGPLVAYIIRLSCWAFGQDTMLAVRFPALLLATATSILTYLLTLKLFRSDRVALGAVLLYHVVPMFLAGSLLMTIDPPYFFCWALATYLMAHAVFDGRRWVWPLIGVAAGLGFLAKYAMFLWFLPMLGFLATDPGSRPLLRSARLWVAVAVALLFLIPVAVWNAKHGWVSFHHVSTQTGTNSAGKFNPGNVLEFVGGQVGVVGPGTFVIMVAAVLYAARPWRREGERDGDREETRPDVLPRGGTFDYERRSEGDRAPLPARVRSALVRAFAGVRRRLVRISPSGDHPEPFVREMRFLAWFGVAFFGLTFLTSLRTKVQVNWPAPAYFSLMILTAYFLATRLRDRETWRPWRWWFYPSVAFGLLASPLAHDVEMVYPAVRWINARAPEWRQRTDNRFLAWLAARVPEKGIEARKIDFTARLKGWEELGARLDAEVEAMRRETGKDVFILCDDYQQTAETAFYMKGQPITYYAGSYFQQNPKRHTQYDVWPDRNLTPPNPLIGGNAIYLGHVYKPTADLRDAFERVEGVPTEKTTWVEGQPPVTVVEQRSHNLEIVRKGVTVRTFRYFKCYGFKGMRRPEQKSSF